MEATWKNHLEATHTKVCPNCQTEVKVFFEGSRIISCPSCRTVFNSDTNRKEKAILGENPKRKPNHPTFLEVGQEFILKSTYRQGDRFKINAHIYVSSKYETLGQEKPYKGKWRYHEWLCTSQSGAYMSIVYDKEGYKLSEPIDIEKEKRINPEKYDNLYFNNQKLRRKVEERSENEILYFEGETQDTYVPGDKFKTASCKFGQLLYGVEWKDANLPDTYAYYEQRPVEEKFLLNKIESANDISAYKKKIANYHFFRKAMLYTSLVLFVLWFISLFYSGANIYKQEFNLARLLDEEIEKGKEIIEINDLTSVYQLDLNVEMAEENTELYAGVEILNENENVINIMQSDFWKAAGIDGGEKWSEESVGLVRYYSFPTTSKLSFVFHAEKTNLTRLSPNDKLIFEVNQGAFLSRYFIILFLIFIVFTIVLYAQGTNSKIRLLFLR